MPAAKFNPRAQRMLQAFRRTYKMSQCKKYSPLTYKMKKCNNNFARLTHKVHTSATNIHSQSEPVNLSK